MRNIVVLFLCIVFLTNCNAGQKGKNTTNLVFIETNNIKVSVNAKSGCFTVLEKKTEQLWNSDPWENAAGLLTLTDEKGRHQTVNLSESKKVEVSKLSSNTIGIQFLKPVFKNGTVANGVVVKTLLTLNIKTSQLSVEVLDVVAGDSKLISLRYPSRQFSLETDVDKGAAVIPQEQGVICPSYIFPMNGGRFCAWDDQTYSKKSIGKIPLYTNGFGLSMPWWGTYNEKSAVVGILNSDSRAEMFYNINNNGQYLFDALGEMTPYKRVVYLDPVWKLNKKKEKREIVYHFIPNGDYKDMTKIYRKEAKERGYFVSLKEKEKKDPNVNKLPGAIYMGIYGGYPHYVNMPGMAFTFDELKEMIKTTHDELGVENAFIHAWGVFSNFPPNCWPISEALGGEKKLKEAVDLAKKYGYLYSSYHAYSPLLENDPDFSTDMMEKRADGKIKKVGNRWARVQPKYQLGLAQKHLEQEIETLGLEADITDITFATYPENGNEGRLALAKYLASLNVVNGTEHGAEKWIPYFDMFEGMAYIESGSLSSISKKVPLFNMVYHDAIALFGKIQNPDNEVSGTGDFRIKALRSILFGRGTTIFFSPYEFDGMKDMIKMANSLVSPIHKETFYAELTSHEFLSIDFKIQKTKFSNGTEVTVNVGPVAQTTKGGITIPGFGYYVKMENGKIKKGHFNIGITLDK
ncbi:hypothetical protein FHR24_002698 [Wenyingzhuangia heitensis]|uniref:Uncharacterized protein n=1 Tax=Wenyingzhuangia heitensis TaxID=1487859 RepID=A0ABX0UBK5_9FLAO|nr:DUF5696 domain-containing protein [Wenyingzhuangia heitensis]NIJ46214.1 hypothetical protein [Wenyingzhuangia heitensis]